VGVPSFATSLARLGTRVRWGVHPSFKRRSQKAAFFLPLNKIFPFLDVIFQDPFLYSASFSFYSTDRMFSPVSLYDWEFRRILNLLRGLPYSCMLLDVCMCSLLFMNFFFLHILVFELYFYGLSGLYVPAYKTFS
jgi:hypothetical protein